MVDIASDGPRGCRDVNQDRLTTGGDDLVCDDAVNEVVVGDVVDEVVVGDVVVDEAVVGDVVVSEVVVADVWSMGL